MALLLPMVSIASEIKFVGNWTIENSEDPFTDEKSVFVYTNPKGFSDELLVMSCRENQPRIFLFSSTGIFTNYYGKFGTSKLSGTPVIYRIEKEAPIETKWENLIPYEDHEYRYKTTSPSDSVRLIENLLNKESFVVRIWDYDDDAHTYEFDVTGIEEAVRPIREDCGW